MVFREQAGTYIEPLAIEPLAIEPQRCALSLLLFVVTVMVTVVMHDAVSFLLSDARAAHDRGDLANVVYDDDTLLLGPKIY